MIPGQFAFGELPEDHFPFTVRFFRAGVQVHEIHVEGPGAVLVPALGRGNDIVVRLEFANGSVTEAMSTRRP